jgi:hypothetical protein
MSKLNTIIGLLIIILHFSAGWYIRGLQIPKEIKPHKIVQNKIKKDVLKMPCTEVRKDLQMYNQSDFITTWNKKNNNTYELKVSLHKRNFTQEVEMPVPESSNFKFYVGFCSGGLITAGAVLGTVVILDKVGVINI